ncbi:MAG: hypothetical protein LC800_09085, partial [Acidobacteria bacterium]|nr:hypothetical protein [Acidobacteriota bacterium]
LLDAAGARIDRALAAAGEYEPFDAEEFDAASRAVRRLKDDLKAAETGESYSPVYGTAEGKERSSSNF